MYCIQYSKHLLCSREGTYTDTKMNDEQSVLVAGIWKACSKRLQQTGSNMQG